jgi:hypothetical protein
LRVIVVTTTSPYLFGGAVLLTSWLEEALFGPEPRMAYEIFGS